MKYKKNNLFNPGEVLSGGCVGIAFKGPVKSRF